MTFHAIDINCDMGERTDADRDHDDEQLLKLVSSANIACGFHAGNPTVMADTVKTACECGVGIGAHPGLADLAGFGRQIVQMSPAEVRHLVTYQIGALGAFVKASGAQLQHVKLHGALYHMVNSDESLARAAADAMAAVNPSLIMLTSGRVSITAAREAGLRVAEEFFVDRAYQNDGSLVARSDDGAVIHDAIKIHERLSQLFETETVTTIDGQQLAVSCHSICVHSDTPNAIRIAEVVRDTCTRHDVSVQPLDQLVS